MDRVALESNHHYIQIIFPLPEPSRVNPSAPLIDFETFVYFRGDVLIRRELRQAFRKMLTFYGLTISLTSPVQHPERYFAYYPQLDDRTKFYKIEPCPLTFASKRDSWVCYWGHNHLRITRIIRSMRILGCQAEAEAFYRALMLVHEETNMISFKSIQYWTRAARRLLNVNPDDGSYGNLGDEEGGRVFLRRLDDFVKVELAEKIIVMKLNTEGDERDGEVVFLE